MIELFTAQTTNASSVIKRLDEDKPAPKEDTINDHNRIIIVSGVLDGASVTIRLSATGVAGTFVDIANNVFTTAVAKEQSLPSEAFFQAEVTNAGASTSVNLHILS